MIRTISYLYEICEKVQDGEETSENASETQTGDIVATCSSQVLLGELQGTAGAPYRLADQVAKLAPHYAAIVIDTRPSFSLMTEMALVASTDAIIPVEPRYLETVGLLSVISKINDIRDGWRISNLRVRGIVVTKMDKRFADTITCSKNSKRIPN